MSSVGPWRDRPAGEVRVDSLPVNGLTTRVLAAGRQARGEAVVLIHGGPGSADDWAQLLPEIGAIAPAIAFDLPGFGKADRPRDWGYSPNEWATFVAAVLAELGVTRAHLVLNDLGGSAGLAWAAAHPDAIASAVLLNTGALAGYRWHPLARAHRVPVLGRVVALTARLGLRTTMRLYEPTLPGTVLTRWREDFDWGTRRALLRFYRAMPTSTFGRIAPDLARLDRPALVVWGARDRFVPIDQAERERQCFPSASIVRLDASGHYPHLDDPHAVADVVTRFLKEQLSLS